MSQNSPSSDGACVFCAIAAGRSKASVVYEDDTVIAFMDRYPVVPGHLLVVPREHLVGLDDLDEATGAHVWSVGREMARALRRSPIRCDGINMLVCDGSAAFQTVFHFHLHVVPRFAGDEWMLLSHDPPERERRLLDTEADSLRTAIGAT